VLAALDGRAPEKTMPVDLAGVLTDCSRRSVPAGLCLRAGTLERAVVLGNESQLGRMVSNLVDNALRYAHSKVELSVTAARGRALITVTDDGPGVPGPGRERIWDRFVRLDDGRSTANGGSGLGLAIVREIAVAHGGGATAGDATPGPGAQFAIELPLLDAENETGALAVSGTRGPVAVRRPWPARPRGARPRRRRLPPKPPGSLEVG
jgi:signal transduction histidine kinase